MNEIKSLNATLDERRTQYNRASNAIVKVTVVVLPCCACLLLTSPPPPPTQSRFEQQVQKLQEQVAAKQKLLAEIVSKMEVLRNS